MCATFNVDKTTVSKYLSELAEDLDMRDGGDVFPSDKAVILTAARPHANGALLGTTKKACL